jgi:hypothetical protein
MCKYNILEITFGFSRVKPNRFKDPDPKSNGFKDHVSKPFVFKDHPRGEGV